MHIGLIGLGKMGFNMRERLRTHGIEVTGYDQNPEVTDVPSIADLVKEIPTPRLIWVMVPSGAITDGVIQELGKLLSPGDLIVDGGNSRYTEDIKHAKELEPLNINYIDCGVSGGIWGLENGYGLMAGGSDKNIEFAMPVFDALRPEGPREDSFVHVGDVGAGHYAKMVHNGIEYGLMQSYAEGYELMDVQPIVKDVTGTFRAWQKGTVVRSWLLDLLVRALEEDPGLDNIAPWVEDSGEGRWTVEDAVAQGVAVPAITAALYARFVSRDDDAPTMKMVAALRNQFGGHAVKRPTS